MNLCCTYVSVFVKNESLFLPHFFLESFDHSKNFVLFYLSYYFLICRKFMLTHFVVRRGCYLASFVSKDGIWYFTSAGT